MNTRVKEGAYPTVQGWTIRDTVLLWSFGAELGFPIIYEVILLAFIAKRRFIEFRLKDQKIF